MFLGKHIYLSRMLFIAVFKITVSAGEAGGLRSALTVSQCWVLCLGEKSLAALGSHFLTFVSLSVHKVTGKKDSLLK